MFDVLKVNLLILSFPERNNFKGSLLTKFPREERRFFKWNGKFWKKIDDERLIENDRKKMVVKEVEGALIVVPEDCKLSDRLVVKRSDEAFDVFEYVDNHWESFGGEPKGYSNDFDRYVQEIKNYLETVCKTQERYNV